MEAEAHALGHLLLSQVHWKGARSEMEHPPLELVLLIWDTEVANGGLTLDNITPAPSRCL